MLSFGPTWVCTGVVHVIATAGFPCAAALLCPQNTAPFPSSIISGSYPLSSPPSAMIQKLLGEDVWYRCSYLGTSIFYYLRLCTMVRHGSLCQSPSTANGDFSDESGEMPWSMNIMTSPYLLLFFFISLWWSVSSWLVWLITAWCLVMAEYFHYRIWSFVYFLRKKPFKILKHFHIQKSVCMPF